MYDAVGVWIPARVRLTPVALMPAVPGVTAVCAALSPPPTPAQSDALETVIFSALWLVIAPPDTTSCSSVKWPAAATKPSAMSTPIVPSTLRSVEPESVNPEMPVSVDQFSGVGATPPVALFTLTSSALT